MHYKEVQLLLVEDNEVDVEAVRRALHHHRIANPLHVARDGVEALAMLRGDGRPPIPRPYIVLLDLNLPRMNGLEFLEALRADEALTQAVVFVLTTSSADEDKAAAYRNHVAGYIVKRDVGPGFIKLVTMLDHYWHIVELPEGGEP